MSEAKNTAYQPKYVIENQTARSLQIAPEMAGDGAPLTIVPFGTSQITPEQYHKFDFERWVDQGLIIVSPPQPPPKVPRKLSKGYIIVAAILGGVGLLGVILSRILATIDILKSIGPILLSLYPLFLLFIIAAALVIGAAYLYQRPDWSKQSGGALALGLVAISVIAVAAIGPALIMMSFSAENVPITGRMMQMVFVVIAALLPALLYFLYDRQKVTILSKTFYREVVRLDPTIHTTVDAEQKYGHLINEVYGDKSAGYYLANVGLPITLSSVLIALGWLLILLPVSAGNLADFFSLANPPQPSALSFGFLGAYFFALNMVFRRYVRSDLTAKAYSHITVRLLVTAILVWAVSVLFVDQPYASTVLPIMAFCIGVVPETAIRVIQEFMRKTIGRFSGMDERDPLTKLDGIDLYDRARLSEEGVENIENLAYHNFINLLVQTRIPARRLADMVDQAILYLHVHDRVPLTPAPPDRQSAPTQDDEPKLALKYLHSYGIRTATDLLYVWRMKAQQGSKDFKGILESQSPELAEFAERINFVVGTLKEADWMLQLLYRRALATQLPEKAVTNPDDFFDAETRIAIQLVKALTEDTLPVSPTKGNQANGQ